MGKIYVKFDSVESANNALKALAGRKFSDRTVVTTYFPEVGLFDDAFTHSLHADHSHRRVLKLMRGSLKRVSIQ